LKEDYTMNLPMPGHASPSASFEAPLEMLYACHQRIHKQCATLRRLVPHLATHGADAQAREAAAQVLRYFDTAAVHHHADEEQDLFPALLESMAGSDAVCLHQLIDGLMTQHRELDARWREVKRVLDGIAAGDNVALEAAAVDALAEAYAAHIAREEGELLPMAARLLDDDALQRIGAAMRERRGIPAVT
jgi:hemerythrin-like domain-containing protein